MRIALINGGIVANLIEADIDFAQTLGYELAIEAPDTAYLGQAYVDGAFVPAPIPEPAPEPVPPTTTVMSKLAFLSRFTQAERIAIRAAIPTDPIIEDANSMLSLADNVDVSHADTVGYVGYLSEVGLLGADRVATILAPVAVD